MLLAKMLQFTHGLLKKNISSIHLLCLCMVTILYIIAPNRPTKLDLTLSYLSEQFQNPVETMQKVAKIDTANANIHDRSLSWLGTSTSIKNGGVKLVLWAKMFKFNQRLLKEDIHLPLPLYPYDLVYNCFKLSHEIKSDSVLTV